MDLDSGAAFVRVRRRGTCVKIEPDAIEMLILRLQTDLQKSMKCARAIVAVTAWTATCQRPMVSMAQCGLL